MYLIRQNNKIDPIHAFQRLKVTTIISILQQYVIKRALHNKKYSFVTKK